MDLRVFGAVHWIYLGITVPLSVVGLLLAKKFSKTEKAQSAVLKSLGALLLIFITINRLSQVFRYSDVRWEQIIPDSFCGMTSLVLALAVLFGKKDNAAYHFTWFLGLVGASITVLNPTFLDQGPSFFICLPSPACCITAWPWSWWGRFLCSARSTLPIENGIAQSSVLPPI